MSLRPFQFIEPDSLEEAVSLLSNDHAHVLAGGSDLLSEMKEGVVSPSSLVSLAGVEELQGVEVSPQGTRIGAMASLASLAANTDLQQRFPRPYRGGGRHRHPANTKRGHLGWQPVPASALLLLPKPPDHLSKEGRRHLPRIGWQQQVPSHPRRRAMLHRSSIGHGSRTDGPGCYHRVSRPSRTTQYAPTALLHRAWGQPEC